jgi:hypothetical protein
MRRSHSEIYSIVTRRIHEGYIRAHRPGPGVCEIGPKHLQGLRSQVRLLLQQWAVFQKG